MNFIRELTRKPWTSAQERLDNQHQGGAYALPTATIGLRVFLGVLTVLFSLLIVAYADRMALGDWRSIPVPWLLWPNTAVLIISSMGLHWAWINANRGRIEAVRTGLLAGGICAFAFLAGQLWAWQDLIASGYFAATNPANAFFYLVTALHGIHLLGGLVAWSRTSAKVRQLRDLDQMRRSVELCAVYWHFLLLVWLVLFGLLLFT